MGKKKGKAEVAQDQYRLMTLEEVRTREVKYINRIEAMKHCMNYMDDMLLQLEILNEENRLLENWYAYLRCDGLPKPYIPPDIRLFVAKLRHFEAESIEKNIDWTLSVDDRSILTQDIFRIDKTWESVKAEKRPNFGDEYNKNVDLALQVIKAIEYYLVDKKMYSLAKARILQDIKEQKPALYREIDSFFDRYCYRILSSESAYMEDVDARSAEYCYKGNNFQIHTWTLKNVPIRFEFLEEPFIVANFHLLNVQITIPFAVLEDNLTIRGLHFDFDHFSESAKSYNQVITVPVEILNAGITDLRDCLANEWKIQVALQLETREIMLQKRMEYEDLKRQVEEEEARKAKEKKDNKEEKKKKRKGIKLPKEPMVLQDNEVPDTWNDFLKKEQKEYEDFLNDYYHPNLLNLESHEVNLKKYLILGGVYQFDFVDKARHFDFNSFNMTWHENDGQLLIRTEMKLKSRSRRETTYKATPNPNTQRDSAFYNDPGFDPNADPWFVIHMKLPEYLCLWGVPKACHFERDVIGYIEEKKPEHEPIVHHKTKKSHSVFQPKPVIPHVAPDSSAVIETLRNSVHSIAQHAVDRRSSIMRVATTTAVELGISPNADVTTMGIDNFDLNYPLTKMEIRNLVRHCLPRIISSYKFPSEFSAEAKERSAKAKSAGGTLIRRHSAQSIDPNPPNTESPERMFLQTEQYGPERFFPVYPVPEELKIRRIFQDLNEQGDPSTFYDLIRILDGIKRYYLTRPTRTANLPAFKPNMKLFLKPAPKPVKLPGSGQSSERGTRVSRRTSTAVSSLNAFRNSTRDMRRKTVELKKLTPHQSDTEEDEDEDENEFEFHHDNLSKVQASKTSLSLTSYDHRKTFTFSRWTTKNIKHTEFDREKRTLTIWTDRLGVLGLAYKRYEQLPFRAWSLEPSEENPENEVTFTLETQYAKVVLFITGSGVRGYVTDLQKKFVRNRPMYLVIEEPLKDFRELRKRFREKNLNIFPEHDASFYIENGYFSQKHLATELHTYCCMCTHAQLMRFLYSEWNRLASRRNLVLRLVHHKESDEYMCTIRVTPEESTFVNIKELCSDDLDVFNLEYSPTWRNIDFYADLDHLITSMYPSASDQRVKNPQLMYFLKAILWEIRPLSYS